MVSMPYKDEEIQNLVKSINDLASIFKDLSVLVVEQGTILDRIDYNVAQAKEHVEMANVELEKTRKAETSTRAQACIRCQVGCIAFLVLIIFLKIIL